MKYSQRKLNSFKRKAPLLAIVKDIEDSGIEIDWNKYPSYVGIEALKQIILDYQVLVPGEQPDLTEMTSGIDVPVVIDEVVEKQKPIKKTKRTEPDWELIRSIDISDQKSYKGRKNIIRAIYLELLFREPDSGGWEEYVNHLKDGLSISNIRDAIKMSKEYKKKHNI